MTTIKHDSSSTKYYIEIPKELINSGQLELNKKYKMNLYPLENEKERRGWTATMRGGFFLPWRYAIEYKRRGWTLRTDGIMPLFWCLSR